MKKAGIILVLLLICTAVPLTVQEQLYLTVAVQEGLQSTNIFRATDEWSTRVLGWFYPPLYFNTSKTRELVPYVAEGMPELLEEKKYAVHLRETIQWDDGKPLTASDVEFTVNLIKELELVGYSPDLETVTTCTASDTYTVVFVLNECTPKFWESVLTMLIVPEHQFLPLLEEARKADDPASIFQAMSVVDPVGAGPFSWGVWMKDEIVKLPSNPAYFFKGHTFQDGHTVTVGPDYDGLLLKVYQTEEDAVQALHQGDVDYIWWQLDPAALTLDSSVSVIPCVRGGFFAVMNHQTPPFTDLVFRQALACLTDQQKISDTALRGWGEPLYSVVLPTAGRWYNPDVRPWCFELERDTRISHAKIMLEEAAYKWDEKGRLLTPDGDAVPPISITIPPADYDPTRVSAALMVAEWWNAVGLTVTVDPIPFADLVEETYTKQTFDVVILGWNIKGSGYPAHLAFFFHSREAVPGGNNPQSYINPDVDTILEYFLLGCDPDSVVQASHDAQVIIVDEVGYLPLYTQYTAEAHREDRFTGWEAVCHLDMVTTPQNPLLNLEAVSRPQAVLPEVGYTFLSYAMPLFLIFCVLLLVWMLMGGRGSFRVAFAILKRGFQAFTSYKLQLFFILLNVPLYILVFYVVGKPFVTLMFSSMTGALLDYGGYDFVSFIFVALIAWPILWAGYDVSARGIRYEQYTGMLEIMISTKYGVKVLPFAYLILGMIGSIFSSVGALAAFVYLLDLEINITNPQAMLGLASVAVISMLTMWGLGLIFSGLTVLYKQLGPAGSILQIALRAFCGIYVPVEILPEYIQPISKILPLTYSFNAIRAALITGESMLAYWQDSLALFGFCIFMIFIGYTMFNWLVNRARRLGSIYGY